MKNFTETTLNTFVALRNSRIAEDAEGGVLFKANNYLYNTLADIYFACQKIADDETTINNIVTHYNELSEKDSASYPAFKSNTPSIIDVAIRFVFADSETTVKRATAYARVLKILSDKKVAANFGSDKSKFVDFIVANGGIEGIDGDLLIETNNKETKNKEKEEQLSNLKDAFLGLSTGVKNTVSVASVTNNAAALKGSHVVLVGVVGADGSITVKHVCSEKEFANRTDKNCGAGVVKAALKNMLKVNDEALSKHLKEMLAESNKPKTGLNAALENKKNKSANPKTTPKNELTNTENKKAA